MRGINFAWLAAWVLSPLGVCDFFSRRLGDAAAPEEVGGECGACPDFASHTLAFAL